MGVRGLTAFLKQGSLSSISDHVDFSVPAEMHLHDDRQHYPGHPHDRRLLIVDGNAFSHWFTLECFGTAPSVNTNYRQLKSLVVTWIMKCYATQVDCIFVFDGATEPDKLQCRLDRLCRQSANMDAALSQEPLGAVPNATDQENEASTRAHDVECNGTGIPTMYQKNSGNIKVQSTPPLLAISCIINAIVSLQSTETRAFYARGEADKTIVEVAVALQATAIMSNDSDMIIYNSSDVGFIPFWGFGFADDGSLNAFIIKRKKVSNLMGISVVNLPILAALVGNDFTSVEDCYHIHKILFEGSKQCLGEARRAAKNQHPLSVDSISLSQSEVTHDEIEVSIQGSQRVQHKTRTKRSDSSLSSSERTKLRRRANRAEEGNKRKENQSKCANFPVPTVENEMQLSDDIQLLDIVDDTVIELHSGVSKDASWSYGESGLKTVKAAALFLKKAECTKKSLTGNSALSALEVISLLIGITEKEVLLCIAENKKVHDESKSSRRSVEVTCKGGNKLEVLCASLYAAFEDSIARYKVSSAADIRKNDSTKYSVASRSCDSALRCCYRCQGCLPSCREIHSKSLAGLLASSSSERNDSLVPCCDDDVSGNAIDRPDYLSLRLQFSPDMDQVLKYGMFVGRTPCSLLTDSCIASADDISQVSTLPHMVGRGCVDNDGDDEIDTIKINTSSPSSTNTDYKRLQPLRKRLYSEIFRTKSSGDLNYARSRCIISEIFKKNKSRHLENWKVLVPSADLDMIGTEKLTSPANHEKPSLLTPCKEILLHSLTGLVLPCGTTPFLHRIFTTTYTFDKWGCSGPDSGVLGRIKNQLFFMALSAHLFLSTATSFEESQGRIVKERSLDLPSSILSAVAFFVSSITSLIFSEEQNLCQPLQQTVKGFKVAVAVPSEQSSKRIHEDFIADELFHKETSTLPFINLWTSFQLCLQHVNFSVEVAAYILPQLQQSVGEIKNGTFHVDDVVEDDDSSIKSALQTVLGGDPGLLDPILFHRARVQLRPCIVHLIGSHDFHRSVAMTHSCDLKDALILFLPSFTPECILNVIFSVVLDITAPAID